VRSSRLSFKPLREYAWLVEEVRKNNISHDETGMSSAVDKAIDEMPNDYVIKPFLEAHRAEVKGMLLTEYNEAEQMELFKEDGRREGRAEGEGLLAKLMTILFEKGLVKEAQDAASNEEIRKELYSKYNLV